MLKGVAASPGIVIGKAVVLHKDRVDIKPVSLSDSRVEKEITDFRNAIARVKKDLMILSVSVGKRLGHEYGRIFEAQALIADDQVINDKVVERIRQEKIQAAYIYYQEINAVIKQLSKSDDHYLKERTLDINSVGSRLINVLQGAKRAVVSGIEGPTVVITKYLSPVDILGFSMRKRVGFAMELGGVTSHTSLLAKSLNLPAIVGIGQGLKKIDTGDKIIIDGYSGKLYINPEQKIVNEYRKRQKFLTDLNEALIRVKDKPAKTRDGHRVRVFNNIELPAETNRVLKSGAEGIGLFRTEYLFLTADSFPDFDTQYKAYKRILSRMNDRPVLIRTFDMGGDKFMVDREQAVDPNPFLGWRAIRFCLDHPEIFKIQLKALLKASPAGNLGIMLPMISNLEELRQTKKLIKECQDELKSEGVKFKNDIPLGIMIEVPSAVLIAEHLAQEVDFFSIGTNDLIQYTLAVDRTNELITHLYQSFHPAVLRMIKDTIKAGHKHHVKVGICGEMASDPYAAIILTGMGIDEISTGYLSTAMIKQVIMNIDYTKARELANAACRKKTAAEVEDYLKRKVNAYFPDLISSMDFIRGVNHG